MGDLPIGADCLLPQHWKWLSHEHFLCWAVIHGTQEMALLAQKTEINGSMNCGIMDQLISDAAKPGKRF
jgi:hypothetical protein